MTRRTLLCFALAWCGAVLGADAPALNADAPPAPISRLERIVTDTLAASTTVPQPGGLSPSAPLGIEGAATTGSTQEGEWVIAPIPMANPTIGVGLAVAAIYSFRPFKGDPGSNPSTLGMGGFYTDSDSWAFGGGIKTSLDGDRWRLKLGGASFDLNYDLYGTGGLSSNKLPVHQSGSGVMFEVQRATARDLFVGLFVAYGETLFVPKAALPPGIPPAELEATIATVGLHLESDRRDSEYYPTTGHRAEYRYADQSETMGSDFQYTKQTAAFNDYASVLGGVIASRLFLCVADGDVPFFDECLYGSGGDLRGYEAGRYRDEAMFAIQVEYRRELAPRWGAIAFVGTGQVMPDFGAVGTNGALPAYGLGLRWNAAPTNHINLRIDYAEGQDGGALYIGIGEAF